MNEIVKRIRKVRELTGKTQKEMGKEFNCSKEVYSNIELGKRKIKVNEVVIFKNRFNISTDWLIYGEGNMYVVENPKVNELNNLILDFRQYGGEVDIVKREIIKKILEKLYKKGKFFFFFKKESHKYGNRPHFALIKTLKACSFDGEISDAKNFLRDLIEEFDDKSYFLKDVKKELYSLLENVNDKDCYYLLKNTSLVVEEIKEKILNIDMMINDLFHANDQVKLLD